MHPYATDSEERTKVPLYIAGLSVGAAWLLPQVMNALALTVPWWFDAPSVIGFYLLFYGIFDRWLWKLLPVVVKIPDLGGEWNGYVASSFDDHKTQHPARLEIQQHWRTIRIKMKTQYSESCSLVTSVITEDHSAPVLIYEYRNEPKASAEETLHIHRGTARLILRRDPAGDILEGDYYTGRDRKNDGMLWFERKDI